jgi:hypothetical protein
MSRRGAKSASSPASGILARNDLNDRDDRDAFQASTDELPAIDIHSL